MVRLYRVISKTATGQRQQRPHGYEHREGETLFLNDALSVHWRRLTKGHSAPLSFMDMRVHAAPSHSGKSNYRHWA